MAEQTIKTKSLLGRQACLSFLNEAQLGGDNSLETEVAQITAPSAKGPPNFNNNIYNNVCLDHTIEGVSNAEKRNLPEAEKEKIALIDRLQAEGKIKSTGRSPVKLKLFEKSAQDHLYVNSVTKRVPVARDQQIR